MNIGFLVRQIIEILATNPRRIVWGISSRCDTLLKIYENYRDLSNDDIFLLKFTLIFKFKCIIKIK